MNILQHLEAANEKKVYGQDTVGGYLKKAKTSKFAQLLGKTNLRYFLIIFSHKVFGYQNNVNDEKFKRAWQFDQILTFSTDWPMGDKKKEMCDWKFPLIVNFTDGKSIALFAESVVEHAMWTKALKTVLQINEGDAKGKKRKINDRMPYSKGEDSEEKDVNSIFDFKDKDKDNDHTPVFESIEVNASKILNERSQDIPIQQDVKKPSLKDDVKMYVNTPMPDGNNIGYLKDKSITPANEPGLKEKSNNVKMYVNTPMPEPQDTSNKKQVKKKKEHKKEFITEEYDINANEKDEEIPRRNILYPLFIKEKKTKPPPDKEKIDQRRIKLGLEPLYNKNKSKKKKNELNINDKDLQDWNYYGAKGNVVKLERELFKMNPAILKEMDRQKLLKLFTDALIQISVAEQIENEKKVKEQLEEKAKAQELAKAAREKEKEDALRNKFDVTGCENLKKSVNEIYSFVPLKSNDKNDQNSQDTSKTKFKITGIQLDEEQKNERLPVPAQYRKLIELMKINGITFQEVIGDMSDDILQFFWKNKNITKEMEKFTTIEREFENFPSGMEDEDNERRKMHPGIDPLGWNKVNLEEDSDEEFRRELRKIGVEDFRKKKVKRMQLIKEKTDEKNDTQGQGECNNESWGNAKRMNIGPCELLDDWTPD